jgi:hypothetical protein
VFIARASIVDASHAAVTREMEKLLERAKLLKEDPAGSAPAGEDV